MSQKTDSVFNETYKKYYNDIYNYSLSRLSCDEQYADDCTQETFLVYYKKLVLFIY